MFGDVGKEPEAPDETDYAGGDKWFDEAKFVKACRKNENHSTRGRQGKGWVGFSGRADASPYRILDQLDDSETVEEIFGWIKEPGRLKRAKQRGRKKVSWLFLFALGIFILVRMNGKLKVKMA
ncbi:MAG: hypothetical protein JW748_10360 [Anaerolineales bacterium]|nr:hypothetical protein [Anaerolineales bacterium]